MKFSPLLSKQNHIPGAVPFFRPAKFALVTPSEGTDAL